MEANAVKFLPLPRLWGHTERSRPVARPEKTGVSARASPWQAPGMHMLSSDLCCALSLSEATAFHQEPPPWKSLSCSPASGKWVLTSMHRENAWACPSCPESALHSSRSREWVTTFPQSKAHLLGAHSHVRTDFCPMWMKVRADTLSCWWDSTRYLRSLALAMCASCGTAFTVKWPGHSVLDIPTCGVLLEGQNGLQQLPFGLFWESCCPKWCSASYILLLSAPNFLWASTWKINFKTYQLRAENNFQRPYHLNPFLRN